MIRFEAIATAFSYLVRQTKLTGGCLFAFFGICGYPDLPFGVCILRELMGLFWWQGEFALLATSSSDKASKEKFCTVDD